MKVVPYTPHAAARQVETNGISIFEPEPRISALRGYTLALSCGMGYIKYHFFRLEDRLLGLNGNTEGLLRPVLPGTPLLRTENLTVRLKTGRTTFDAVSGVTFDVHSGETLCLVGESGCGKSLTALAVLRLLPDAGSITSGQVLFEGENLTALPESRLREIRGRHIGMIFQEPMTSLNPVLRVGDQTAEPLRRHLGMGKREALAHVESLFRQVGIPSPESRLRDYPHRLSGGMRQRVMIATALACSPRLLLADEPTTALDVTIQGQILTLLKTLIRERGMGLVLITHDLGVVAETADQVAVMYAGRIVEQTSTHRLFATPLHPYTIGLMASAPTPQTEFGARLAAVPGSVPAPGAVPSGCVFRPRCSRAFSACLEEPPLFAQPAGGHEAHRVRCWLHEP